MTISLRIRELKADMSIAEFARLIGEEKPQRLQDVLLGRQRVPEDMLVRMLVTTGCDANWLLLGDAKTNSKPSPKEFELLENYRKANASNRKAIENLARLAAAHGDAPSATKPPLTQLHVGDHGIQIGSVHQSKIAMPTTSKKRASKQ
jgi:hypothetical protein